MQLRLLHLKNFRSYGTATFTFSPGVNIITGSNGCGKTTLLEAIYLLVSGHSFRTAVMGELIKHGQPCFSVEAHYFQHGVEQSVSLTYGPDTLKVTHNSTVSGTLMTLLGALSGVVMVPDDAALVKGSPQVRRRYLDLQIAQSDLLYIHYARRYQRALRQRNALLKKRSILAIEGWEQEMATAAAYMSSQRAQVLEVLSTAATERYEQFSGEPLLLSLKYTPAVGAKYDSDSYLAQFQRLRRREIEVGYTLKGPHKDDFVVAIGEHPARQFGSEGQQRSCIAAMRFSEWERLHQALSVPPLMLVDDLAISLDSNRSQRICEQLEALPSQVFLTTTDANAFRSYGQEQKVHQL